MPEATRERLLDRIDKLSEDPYSHQAKKLVGAGRQFRIRVGDYRIIYEVDDQEHVVTVSYVRHRRDAYRSL